MDNVDLNVLKTIAAWTAAEHRVVLGTIVRTWGSAPRPIGSLVAVRDDGQIAGSVSGGCIEDDLIEQVRERLLDSPTPAKLHYGISAEEANRFGLPCGGSIELVVEPVVAHSRIDELLNRLLQGERIERTLELATGRVDLQPGDGPDRLLLTATHLTTRHGPQWRLLIVGAGQMTQYLASMALALDYEVLICDPREEYADTWQIENTTLLRDMPDDAVLALKPDAHTAIVALTHDPKLDDLALMEALKTEAFYVGAIGSQLNQERRRARLLEFDVSPQQLERLHGPVGIRNGARTPPEIAVAILAHITAERYGYTIVASPAVKPE